MFEIRYATENDKTFWFTLDKHISEAEFLLKIRDKRGYTISDDNKSVGVMRYNLFWEGEMRKLGHKMVMTSTQVDEQAQHFYRKLGYVEKGSLFLDNTPIEQPQEIFMLKNLKNY